MYRTPALSIAFRVHLVKARGRSRSIPQTSLSFANAKDIPRSQSHFAPEPAPHSMEPHSNFHKSLGEWLLPLYNRNKERENRSKGKVRKCFFSPSLNQQSSPFENHYPTRRTLSLS
ncbi:hypothetical protein M9H77_08361 [Catharanthus roseus]|uniref:Uncharacterized protein n=1 Tax=Catharanthus roseus TaxID=4058 RepID=A0ACC0BXX2_CATRO|nr:hypothetical protein M9H77_08361 [Catharanthus roseus]